MKDGYAWQIDVRGESDIYHPAYVYRPELMFPEGKDLFISFVFQGHDHYREDLIYDNVRYTVIGTIRDEPESPEYVKVQVAMDHIDLDWQLIQ